MKRWAAYLLLAFSALLAPLPASATLIGDSIDLSLDFTDPQHTDESAQDVVVGTDAELQAPFAGENFVAAGSVTVDVGGSSIAVDLICFSEGAQFEPPFLPALTLSVADLDLIDEPGVEIVGIEADPGNDPGFSASFSSGEVTIAYAGIPPAVSNDNPLTASGVFTIQTALVPEPSSAILAGLGLAGLVASDLRGRRRARRRDRAMPAPGCRSHS